MAQPASGSENCNSNNNNLNGSRDEIHDNQDEFVLFPGFTINNKNDFEDHTPITKIPCGPVLNCTNSAKSNAESSSTATTKTPPAEPSVSPEIQSNLCHSVLVSGAEPSTCYAVGHVLSGVTDRRKCKARGILSVGKTGQKMVTKSRPSMIPFPPVEASVSWHLSPSHVDEDVDDVVIATINHEPVISLEERLSSFDFNECSPFSAGSLGSENIMQTPNSDSSLERHASLSWLKEGIQPKHQFESELDQVTDVQHESFSPYDNSSPWDPPRLSFELTDSSSPSDLTNLNHLRENSGIHESWISNSTSETASMSVSEIRVSWKDELISSICDKDDLDSCRLFSDEEIDADEVLKSASFIDHEVRVDEKVKEMPPVRVNPCAESICTDGGGLIASGDSDWTLNYKNRSFEF
ncbi:hypothetical protein L1987_37406 [Smallanthus sonchifolius]|uniref:Uncharacterized protein n=1 Tax=Smallanthus sonchifolius TaxID=185202 RepID=A0ACB9HFV5_9ASTR|nr:hypothetical protein L1987_37406 [Smallanthus sonchifolius]